MPPENPTPAANAAKPAVKRQWLLAVLGLTFFFILMPFLIWQGTWFGRPLTDAKIRETLVDNQQPRDVQHALSQVADRILSSDPAVRSSARQFYPQVVKVSGAGDPELRLTAAWVMGQDNSVAEFHQALLQLLRDSDPMVRRNAALALVRFGDSAGGAEIRAIFKPFAVVAPQAGTLDGRLKPGETINPGTLLGHVQVAGQAVEIRSEVPGTINRWLVPSGQPVSAQQPILLVNASDDEIWEALRALYLVGDASDLTAVDQWAGAGNGASDNIRQQAQRTAAAIRARASGAQVPAKPADPPQPAASAH